FPFEVPLRTTVRIVAAADEDVRDFLRMGVLHASFGGAIAHAPQWMIHVAITAPKEIIEPEKAPPGDLTRQQEAIDSVIALVEALNVFKEGRLSVPGVIVLADSPIYSLGDHSQLFPPSIAWYSPGTYSLSAKESHELVSFVKGLQTARRNRLVDV